MAKKQQRNWVCNAGIEPVSDLNPKEGDIVSDNAPDDYGLRFARILDLCGYRGLVLDIERKQKSCNVFKIRKAKPKEEAGTCIGL